MSKLSDADEAYLAKLSSFQRDAARKELEAKAKTQETKSEEKTTTKE